MQAQGDDARPPPLPSDPPLPDGPPPLPTGAGELEHAPPPLPDQHLPGGEEPPPLPNTAPSDQPYHTEHHTYAGSPNYYQLGHHTLHPANPRKTSAGISFKLGPKLGGLQQPDGGIGTVPEPSVLRRELNQQDCPGGGVNGQWMPQALQPGEPYTIEGSLHDDSAKLDPVKQAPWHRATAAYVVPAGQSGLNGIAGSSPPPLPAPSGSPNTVEVVAQQSAVQDLQTPQQPAGNVSILHATAPNQQPAPGFSGVVPRWAQLQGGGTAELLLNGHAHFAPWHQPQATMPQPHMDTATAFYNNQRSGWASEQAAFAHAPWVQGSSGYGPGAVRMGPVSRPGHPGGAPASAEAPQADQV